MVAKSRAWGAGNYADGGDIRRSNPIKDFNERMGIDNSSNGQSSAKDIGALRFRLRDMMRGLDDDMSRRGVAPPSSYLDDQYYG
jgi:hypothetical protein